jgi:hypothetical protein
VLYDRAPLQATQFEADIRIARQLEKLWLEKGGGGNACESYTLPWYFAALHTATDCFEKRGKKGYLFTVGDEEPPLRFAGGRPSPGCMGDRPQRGISSSRELLTLVGRMLPRLSTSSSRRVRTPAATRTGCASRWVDLLGQRVIGLSDHTKLAEVIVSAIEVNEGRDRDAGGEKLGHRGRRRGWCGGRLERADTRRPGAAAGVVRF